MIPPEEPQRPTTMAFTTADVALPSTPGLLANSAVTFPASPAREWSMPHARRSPRYRRTPTMVAVDAVPFVFAWGLARLLGQHQSVALLQDVVMAAVAVTAIALNGAYRDARRPSFVSPMDHRLLHQLVRFVVASSLAAWAGVLVDLDFGRGAIAPGLALIWAAAPVWWLVARALSRRFIDERKPRGRAPIIGSGEVAERLAMHLARSAPSLEIVGRADDGDDPRFGGPLLLGELDDLAAIVARKRIDHVFVAFSHRGDAATAEALRTCDAIGVHTLIVPRLFDILGDRPRPLVVGSLPLHEVRPVEGRNAREPVRRIIDVTIAAVALILLSPVVIVVALLVALIDGSPILYCQERIGRYGRPFKVRKFRTMQDGPDRRGPGRDAPAGGAAQEDVADFARAVKQASMAQVTGLGRLLRATSLDELPQLWNVLRGDMSIVGPRPLREYEVRSLESWQLTRLRVRPGITGLWQVRGRSDLDWSERMRLDYLYVRHRSVVEDLAIMTDTIPAVLMRRGAM